MTEQEILQLLGVPANLQQSIMSGEIRLVIFEPSSHMDWDWLVPFPVLLLGGGANGYFDTGSYARGPARQIYTCAAQLLAGSSSFYSVCEMGFLRGFSESDPATFASLLGSQRLFFDGAGITSPDNCLSHGEAFIRNYLVARVWLASLNLPLPAISQIWIPDDFGHDVQLPATLAAMGITGVATARVPGDNRTYNPTLDGKPQLAQQLLDAKSIDFRWQASDQSTVIAHWMPCWYSQGGAIATATDVDTCFNTNARYSPTPYVHVPVENDFALPNQNLVSAIGDWNQQQSAAYAVTGTFEQYVALVAAHLGELSTFAADPTPYYTGTYGTREGIKRMHQKTVRTLLAAESLSVIASLAMPFGGTFSVGTGTPWQARLLEAWNAIAPSTHHDFITGTAIWDVCWNEQMPLLASARQSAAQIRRDAEAIIAGCVDASSMKVPAVVMNALGFERALDLAVLPKRQLATITSPGSPTYQLSAEGDLLFFVQNAPSIGYVTTDLASPATPPPANLAVVESADSCVLGNGLVQATLQPDANGSWELVSLIDLTTSDELIAGGVANQIQFYADGGSEYFFGMEPEVTKRGSGTWELVTAAVSHAKLEVLESGTLRVRVRTTATFSVADVATTIVREYMLVAGESMLRLRAFGGAPVGYSILTAFQFGTGPDDFDRGTPNHWTNVNPSIDQPPLYWSGITFFPTHNFIVPHGSGAPMFAIYHADMHAWGWSWSYANSQIVAAPTLYGCLWRNMTGSNFNSDVPPNGTNPFQTVRDYAIRVPSGLGSTETGQPLREALAFASPLRARLATNWESQGSEYTLPATLSLATLSDANAIVTVAKQAEMTGDVIFRIYSAANQPVSMTLTVPAQLCASGANAAVAGVTALETPLSGDAITALDLSANGNVISFTAGAALTTLAVTPPPAVLPQPQCSWSSSGLGSCGGSLGSTADARPAGTRERH